MSNRRNRRNRRNRSRYEYSPSNQYARHPAHRSEYRREGCLSGTLRTLATIGIIGLITIVTVLLVVFVFTHVQQVIQLVKAIFTFISFLISVFPLLLRIGLALLGLALVLLIGFGFVHLISTIRERMAQASLASSKAKQAKIQAKLQKDQGKLEIQRKQVVLAQENHVYDQKVRRDYALGDAPQQPVTRRATRNLVLEEQTAQRQRDERQQAQSPSSMPPPIPSISQLIGTSVHVGQTDMLHGFEVVNGSLEEVRGEPPITAIVAGRGGSGKTRRIILMVFQAILAFHAVGGGKITICDPHWIKPDGLANVLAPFADWLHFARTDDEIIAAAKEHVAEMESRLTPQGSLHGEGLQPRLIIIDEFGRLMKSEDISAKDKHILTKCVRETAVQWRGVKGRAWIGGQEFTADAIGDTAIRKDAQDIFCHQLSDEYASFLFTKDTKAQRLVQKIGRRECVYKDTDNGVRRIATITVDDPEIDVMVAYLARCVPRQIQQRRQTVQIPPRPRTQPIVPRSQVKPGQFAAAQQRTFYLAQTEDLRPKQPSAGSQQRTTSASTQAPTASATWGGDLDNDEKRRQYGHSRTLERTPPSQTGTPGAQPPVSATEDVNRAGRQDADDSWATIFVPESQMLASLGFTSGSPQPHAADQLMQRSEAPVNNESDFALLAQLQQKKKR